MFTDYEKELIKTIKDRETEFVAIQYASQRLNDDSNLYVLESILRDLSYQSIEAAKELILLQKDGVS